MNQPTKYQLAELLNYVLVTEESDFEETLAEYGAGSDEAEHHIYSLARNLWTELQMDITEDA